MFVTSYELYSVIIYSVSWCAAAEKSDHFSNNPLAMYLEH